MFTPVIRGLFELIGEQLFARLFLNKIAVPPKGLPITKLEVASMAEACGRDHSAFLTTGGGGHALMSPLGYATDAVFSDIINWQVSTTSQGS